MRVLVTLQNIMEYGLDTVTGNSRADLLARAEELERQGEQLYVRIPDVEGGENDEPTERNSFEHFGGDLPEPEGHTHKQESLNLAQQGYVKNPCSYGGHVMLDGSIRWLCVLHDEISKHSVDGESHEPCVFVDPYDD